MSKKLFFIISIVLVLVLVSEKVIADPNLLGWWNFDDGTANDSSTYGHHGTIRGDVTIVEDANIFGAGNKVGYFPGGDGNDISCGGGGGETWANGMEEITIAAWVQIDQYTTEYQYIAAKEGAWRIMRYSTTTSPRFYTNGTPTSLLASTDIQGGDWHHICGVSDGTTKYIYIDGVLENSVTRVLGIYDSTYNIIIGGTERPDSLHRMWKGLIDDVRLYDRSLAESEVRGLAGLYMAYDPNPEIGEVVLETLASLSWKPGVKAAATQGNKVYFGTNQSLVEANDVSVLKGTFDSNSFTGAPMGSLEVGTAYYWRVTAVNGVNEWPGEVWQFQVRFKKALSPDPPDGAKYVNTSRTNVSWQVGTDSIECDVYFGTDETLVTNGDISVSKGSINDGDPCEWTISPALIAGETYYWRVDSNTGTEFYPGDIWSFETMAAPTGDPNLIGWWKLEEMSKDSKNVFDASGNEHYGTVLGTSTLVYDVESDSNVVYFPGNGESFINCGGGKAGASDPCTWADFHGDTMTIAAWFRTDGTFYTSYQYVCAKENMWRISRYSGGDYMRFFTTGLAGGTTGNLIGTIKADDGEWHHIAGVYDGTMKYLYFDGKLDNFHGRTGNLATSTTWDVMIGANGANPGRNMKGWISDVRLYDRALSPLEVFLLGVKDPNKAWDPYPANKQEPVYDRPITLTWRSGLKAQTVDEHKVYFGTDQALVEGNDVSVYQGVRDVNNWPAGGISLDYSKTYYWKVNEVNGATEWPGDVWWFRMRNFVPWEDFEIYNDSDNLIYNTWVPNDFTGSGAFINRGLIDNNDPVNGGEQSMKYEYTNAGTAYYNYTEACRDFGGDPCDWSWATGGVKSMRLYFYGKTSNYPDDMYIVLEDSNTNEAMKLYDRDLSDVNAGEWKYWDIDLSWFTDGANNVHLGYVKKVYLGFGERGSTSEPASNLTGTVYFDSFRVYPPHCVSNRLVPTGDISGNCIVNYVDIDRMSTDWLDYDYTITPSNPGDANLLGCWNFDDGTTNDSSGNGRHGTLVQGDLNTSISIVYDANIDSNVLDVNNVFDANNSVVDCGGGPGDAEPNWAGLIEQVSVTAWFTLDYIHRSNQYMITKGNTWQITSNGTSDGLRAYMEPLSDTTLNTTTSTMDGQWHHVAITYDSIAEERKLYIDGTEVGSDEPTGTFNVHWNSFVIGGRLEPVSNYNVRGWQGRIDDVRLYDDVLTQEEVFYLAGYTGPVYFPITSPANLTDAGDPCEARFVDFKDYDILADHWLEELLWPSGW